MESREALESKLARFESLLQQDAGNVHLIMDCADLAKSLGDIRLAISFLKRIPFENQGGNKSFRLAECYMMDKQFETALDCLERISIDEVQINDVVTFNQAYCHAALGQFEQADTILNELNKRNNLPESLLLGVRVKHLLGDLLSAKALIDQYAIVKPDDAEGLGVAALVYLDAEDNQEAARLADAALAINPGQREALVVRGMLYVNQQDVILAKECFEQVLAIDASSGRAWLGLGMVSMLEGDLPSSEELLKKALDFMPQHLGSWVTLAWNQLSQKKFEEAGHSVKQAMAIDRNFDEIHGTLAVLLIAQGDLHEAEKEKDIALKLNPFSFSGLYAKSLLLYLDGKEEEATHLVDNVLSAPVLDDQRSLNDVIAKLAIVNQ